MFAVDITYIITALVGLGLGLYIGRRLGLSRGRMEVFRIGLEVKNPEMWELLHFLVVEDREQETAALERKTGSRRRPQSKS